MSRAVALAWLAVAGWWVLGCGKSSDSPPRRKPAHAGDFKPRIHYLQLDAGDLADGLMFVCDRSTAKATPPSPAPSSPAAVSDAEHLAWCSVDPASGEVVVLNQFRAATQVEPALWRGGDTLLFAITYPDQLVVKGISPGGTLRSIEPARGTRSISHPTLSRDGRLLAYASRSAGSAKGGEVEIVGVEMATGEKRRLYAGDHVAGPVLSPTADLLVVADRSALHVLVGTGGQAVRDLPVPESQPPAPAGKALVSSCSGLAFTPDGRKVAYLSAGEAEVDVAPTTIVTVDIDSGAATQLPIPRGYCGWNRTGTIGLDFSPDGRYLVFSGATMDAQQELVGPFLVVADRDSGEFTLLERAGRGSQPVWKGR